MRESYSILLVDDEADMRAAARRALHVKGYSITEAATPEEALKLLGENRFDSVVADYHMPTMSGLELLSAVKQQAPQVLRVLLTGRADVEIAVRALNGGVAHRLLVKPWESTDLRGVLRLALHLHRDAQNNNGEALPARVARGGGLWRRSS